tara:strand:+ start:413 stop:817 length:405 start_codon:yes stop_codon:yes gene_type:complete
MKIEEILRLVELDVHADLNTKSRKRELVYARAIYFKLAKDMTKRSCDSIGKLVSRDHASVLHGIKLFDNVISEYEMEYVKIYKELRFKIGNIVGNKYKYLDPHSYYKEKYTTLLIEHRKLLKNSYDIRQNRISL